jgi:chromosome segregation ATPase
MDLRSALGHHIAMANDNKKINDLVSENDDTSELEVLTATVVFDRSQDGDYASESDAATQAFESPARATGSDDASIAALKSDLQIREENINNLQYDIAELRARWTGLEKELKAREELTDNVTSELEQSNRKLAQTISLLRKRDSRIVALETSLQLESGKLAEAGLAIEHARGEIDSVRAEMEATKSSHHAAQETIGSLNSEFAAERAARTRAEDAEQAQGARLEQLEAEHDESTLLIATLQQYIDGRKSSWERQEADLKFRGTSLKEQRKENARLAREVRVAAERLRKESAARQRLQTERDSLQTGLQQANAEAATFSESLAAAEKSCRAQHEEIAALARQVQDAAPALAQEQGERRRLEAGLGEQQRQRDLLQAELAALQESYSAKDSLLAEQQDAIEELRQAGETAARQLAEEQTRSSEFEQQLAPLQIETGRLRREQGELSAEAAERETLLREQAQELLRLSAELEATRAALETERTDHRALLLQHDEFTAQLTALRSEIGPLRSAASRLADVEQANAELSGLVSSTENVIRELKGQLGKTESYADSLRMKLQQQQAAHEALCSERDSSAGALKEALARVDELAGRLGAEQELSARLQLEKAEAGKRLEEEVRTMCSELDAAQKALADKQAMSEQLTADLVEGNGKVRMLEEQLAEADKARDSDIRNLSRQVAQFRKQIDDYERKISNKDAAINALLTELAHKPETPEDSAAADDVVHRLADRRPQPPDDRAAPHHEKDRVTRLLIGSIDGQELRFPLFKDKLTIGRTVHNDIQLKAQYVSRRHAVVVTEDDRTRIVDWGSKNGIYVNGKRVGEHMLRNGDRVSVGTADFKYEERPKR